MLRITKTDGVWVNGFTYGTVADYELTKRITESGAVRSYPDQLGSFAGSRALFTTVTKNHGSTK